MAVSYVIVSASAVVLVEAVLLALFLPRIRSADDSLREARQRAAAADARNLQSKVATLALETASATGTSASLASSARPGLSDRAMLAFAAKHGFNEDTLGSPGQPPSNAVKALATLDGHVVAVVGMDAADVPAAAFDPRIGNGMTTVDGQSVGWASHPVEIVDRSPAGRRTIGIAYRQLSRPGSVAPGASEKATGTGQIVHGFGSVLLPGLVILILLVPVGALFGLFSTGRLIRRIRLLSLGTARMAEGDLRSRIPVSGRDEVGRLEQSFNSMAERLESAVRRERAAAGAAARRAERSRITRELHDSISQDLFSASLLAGGLRKALPDGSQLRHQAESMETALERTMREMRAMLLELRPIKLEDSGLVAALTELCQAYEARLGISISTDLGELRLEPQIEHAVLRVVQEALGNAVRHGESEKIELSVNETGGQVVVMVRDEGRGFDPHLVAGRHGMGLELMRERVGELGGVFELVSAPARGTTVRVLLPGGTK